MHTATSPIQYNSFRNCNLHQTTRQEQTQEQGKIEEELEVQLHNCKYMYQWYVTVQKQRVRDRQEKVATAISSGVTPLATVIFVSKLIYIAIGLCHLLHVYSFLSIYILSIFEIL